MLSILSSGASYPPHHYDDQALGLPHQTTPEFCPSDRRFSLPLEYLVETKNLPIKTALKHALCSPTDLGAEAVSRAAASIGISVEALELVIGDSCTPWEVCPSEGQRVAGKLGKKIAAYDVSASSCVFSSQLASILRWKDGKLPAYTALLSTNVATQIINFGSGVERYYFGDGAGAAIISSVHKGKFTVLRADYSVFPMVQKKSGYLSSPLFLPLSRGTLPEATEIEALFASLISYRPDAGPHPLYVIASPFFEGILASWTKKYFEIKNVEMLSLASTKGDLLGGYSFCTLAEFGDSLPQGAQVLILECGAGFGVGAALLQREGGR